MTSQLTFWPRKQRPTDRLARNTHLDAILDKRLRADLGLPLAPDTRVPRFHWI